MNTIEVIARGLLIKDYHLLVCKGKNAKYFYLPGGHIEFGETAEEALHREWHEELACDCNIQKYLTHFEERFVVGDKKHHEYTFLYQVDCEKLSLNEPLPHPEEDLFFEWLPLDEKPSLHLYPESTFKYIQKNFANLTFNCTPLQNLQTAGKVLHWRDKVEILSRAYLRKIKFI